MENAGSAANCCIFLPTVICTGMETMAMPQAPEFDAEICPSTLA